MTHKTLGYAVLAAAMSMMFGLLTVDISRIQDWGEVTSPGFVASFLGHVGVVLGAYASGRLVPDNREGKQTRSTDVRE